MNDLNIPGTEYTPEVRFNAGTGLLEISGSSYPENAFEFFKPLQGWIREYSAVTRIATVVNLKLVYINTSSSKCILDILTLLEKHSKNSGNVQINWYHERDDEDMLETGKEFAEDMELNFSFIPY